MTREKPVIVVTQGEDSDGPLASCLTALGAEVVLLPTISIEPAEDYAPLDRALDDLDRFDWIVFTSRHAVDATIARPAWEAARGRTMPKLRVAAVGKVTAARLAQLDVIADVVPVDAGSAVLSPSSGEPRRQAGAAALARELAGAAGSLTGKRVLWPRSDIARRELADALTAAGAELVDPIAYRTTPFGTGADPAARAEHAARLSEFLARLDLGGIDGIAFMSPSSAKNLVAALGRSDLGLLRGRAAIASIGPTTSACLSELGAPADVESATRYADDLARTLMTRLVAGQGAPR